MSKITRTIVGLAPFVTSVRLIMLIGRINERSTPNRFPRGGCGIEEGKGEIEKVKKNG